MQNALLYMWPDPLLTLVKLLHMRHCFLLLFLLVFGVAVAVPVMGMAAPAAPEIRYEKARAEFDKLKADPKRSQFRDQWQRVAGLFMDVHATAKGWPNAPAALFRAAEALEELADRSRIAPDYAAAAERFEKVAALYPKSALADDGLYRAARIRGESLGDAAAARRLVARQQRDYPTGDMIANARALERKLGPAVDAPSGTAAAKADAAPARAVATKPEATPPVDGGAPRSVAGARQEAATSSVAETRRDAAGKDVARLRQVSWKGNAERTQIVVELDRRVEWQVEAHPAKGTRPARVLLDLAATQPDPKVGPGAKVSGSVLSRVRVDLAPHGSMRLVFDFEEMARYKIEEANSPYRIIITVAARDAALPDGEKPNGARPAAGAEATRQVEVPAAMRNGTPKDIVEQLGLTVKTILVDPGHGGKDPGAMDNGITERDLTLAVAKLVVERLRAKGFKVVTTRDKDVFIPLEDRTQHANGGKVDLFLSIHVNANTDRSISGFETYYLDLASTSSAARVASRENAVSEKNLSDLQFILTDLMLSAKTQESRSLAQLVQAGVKSRTAQGGYSLRDNGVRSAPFYVLMGARMPAVLVELGYCTNPAEARNLKSPAYRATLADGIVEGVLAYQRKLQKFSGR